jgi:diguanylate cyclase (GGDEF)-like protein
LSCCTRSIGYAFSLAAFADTCVLYKRFNSVLRTAAGRAVLLFWVCVPIHGQNEAFAQEARAQDTRIVFAGDKANYYPYHFLDKNEVPKGFDVELFQSIAENEGWLPEFQFHEWSTSLSLLEAGEVDVVPMFVTRARIKKYLFSGPILSRNHLVFGRKGSEYIDSIDDLSSRRVAVQYAGMAWEELQSRSSSIMIIPVDMESAAITAVARGQADYALVPAYIGYHTIKHNELKGIVAVSPPLMERAYAFAISRTRPELLQSINAQLRQHQTSGEQDELYMKWLANLVPPSESYRSGLAIGLWIALPLLLTSAFGYVWWRRAHQRAEEEAKLHRLSQEKVHFLAFCDPTTGLPNRNALQNRLSAVIKMMADQSGQCALMRIDLDNLDLIQTVAGQELSDQVIGEVARRLVAQWGGEDVAHLGYGEFAVILQGSDSNKVFKSQLSVVMTLVQQRIVSRELALALDCRSGLAQFPDHGTTAAELIRAAEMACTAARQCHSRTRTYDPDLEPDPRNLTLLGDLRDAVLDGTLGYAVQPKLCLSTRRIIGVEMLVRWHHPKYGALSPNTFVPLAEQTGFISAMTLYLVQRALLHCREWQQLGHDMYIAVNVSVNDLADTDLVDAIVKDAEGVGHMLILEVTETDVMRDTEAVLRSIDLLRRRGIRISLDDFGTGHASLTYLQRMAPDELKIDRSFVTNLLHSASDQAIVRTSIQLAHDLGATVTAEGVEDARTLEWLAAAGCDVAQGFAIAKPMALSELMSSKLPRQA